MVHQQPDTLAAPPRAAPDNRCNLHVYSMHLAGERLWTAVVRGNDNRVRFDRTEQSLRLAVRYALTEAERRGLMLSPS